MDWSQVKSLTIPEGDVKSVAIGGTTVWTKPNPLPYDAEVEYLATTGTQYIRTGVVPNGLNVFKFAAMIPIQGGSDRAVFAVDSGAAGRDGVSVSIYNNNTIFGYKNGYTIVAQPPFTKKSYVIDGGEFYIDGTLVADRGTARCENNNEIVLFAWNRNGSVLQVSGEVRIYNFKAYDENNDLIRDFVPVRFTNELGNSEGAMYDRVSGQLFGNAGSGVFTIGPDK